MPQGQQELLEKQFLEYTEINVKQRVKALFLPLIWLTSVQFFFCFYF